VPGLVQIYCENQKYFLNFLEIKSAKFILAKVQEKVQKSE
jgi:hypothetical protein